jgi:hypothetical protein
MKAVRLVKNIAAPFLDDNDIDCPIADNQYPCFLILWIEVDRNGNSKLKNEVVALKDFEDEQ